MSSPENVITNLFSKLPYPKYSQITLKINQLSTQTARRLHKQNRHTNAIIIFFYPFFKFVHEYFIKLNIFNGPQGFILSVFLSFHTFLTYGKLYLLNKNP